MDLERAVVRAQELRADGNIAGALSTLKGVVRQHPASLDARRALAELYRELGYPDQAGRWGAAIDGWATARELNLFARSLAQRGPVSRRSLRTFLELPPQLGLPPGLLQKLTLAASRYRGAALAEWHGEPLAESRWPRVATATVILWVAIGLSFVFGLVVIYFFAVVNGEAAMPVARVIGAATSGLMAVATVLTGVERMGRARYKSGVGLVLLGAVWLIVIVFLWALTGLSYSWDAK